MTDSIDSLTEKTEKLAIDEKYETNWCDMPPEIKRACIEKMNFLTRLQLRCTASQEKEIVDSTKYKFDSLSDYGTHFSLQTKERREHYELIKFGHHQRIIEIPFYGKPDKIVCTHPKMLSVLTFALKTCNFDSVELNYCGLQTMRKPWDEVDWENIHTLFKPKEVILAYESDDHNQASSGTINFLKKCWNNVETISIAPDNFALEELPTIPSVINAKTLYFWDPPTLENPRQFIPFIEKWIENDAKIGTRLLKVVQSAEPSYPIEELFEKFEYRQISRQDSKMRIKTNNDGKHILMALDVERDSTCACYVVIPSDLEESQYKEHLFL